MLMPYVQRHEKSESHKNRVTNREVIKKKSFDACKISQINQNKRGSKVFFIITSSFLFNFHEPSFFVLLVTYVNMTFYPTLIVLVGRVTRNRNMCFQ